MIRRVVLLATALLIAAACSPGSSPSDGIGTTPPLESPGTSIESMLPDESMLPSESPMESMELPTESPTS